MVTYANNYSKIFSNDPNRVDDDYSTLQSASTGGADLSKYLTNKHDLKDDFDIYDKVKPQILDKNAKLFASRPDPEDMTQQQRVQYRLEDENIRADDEQTILKILYDFSSITKRIVSKFKRFKKYLFG